MDGGTSGLPFVVCSFEQIRLFPMGMVGRRKASMIRFESGAGFALLFYAGELWKFGVHRNVSLIR